MLKWRLCSKYLCAVHMLDVAPTQFCTKTGGRGKLSGESAGLVIERLRVRIPAGVMEEFSSQGSTFCADSYFSICSIPV